MIELRDYQLDTNRRIWRAFETSDAVLMQAPTGSGKTAMAAHYISMRLKHKREKVLMLAHRREIVNQTTAKLMDVGLETGIIMAGHAPMSWADVQVGSIDTLRTRKAMPDADLLVIDECHRAAGDTYSRVIQHYRDKGAKLLGLTATPIRTDGRGLGAIFQTMIRTPDIAELQKAGFLSPIRYRVGLAPDMSKVKATAGEYNQAEREEAHDKGILIGDIVDNWIRFASGMKTMVFASGVRHSIHIVEQFKAAGIMAEHVDGDTPKEDRDRVYEHITNGDLQVVSNAQVYIEGTDIPCIACIVDASATKSLGKYLQGGGRGMRPYPGKDFLLYMDHSGNVMRHGLLETSRTWILTEGKEQIETLAEERKTTEKLQIACKQCGFLHNCMVCPQCGYTFKPAGEAAEFLPGVLVEMTQDQFEKEMEKRKPKKPKKGEVSMDEKQAFYSGLLWLYRERGKANFEGIAAHRYKEKFGVWPNQLRREPREASEEVCSFDHHCRIRWAKSQARATA